MTEPAEPGAPDDLAANQLLGGRYLLLAAHPGPGPAQLWQARDEVLARAVAVKALRADHPAAPALSQAAVLTGAVVHPGLARIHDVTQVTQGSRPPGPNLTLVISEWVDGQRLDDLLGGGPVEVAEAVGLLRQAAAAVTALHAQGLAHGRLHPGNVLVTAAGQLKLTDPGVGFASATKPAQTGRLRSDTRDLAALLYALLTARWPATATDQPAGSVDAARVTGGRPLQPRQLRAAVPRQLDALVTAALDLRTGAPVPSSPAALAAAVGEAGAQAATPRTKAQRTLSAAGPGRYLPWLALAVVLVGVGTVGWLLGVAVGDLPRRDDAVQAIVSTTPRASPGTSTAAAPLDLTSLPVSDFDPPPGDGQENPDTVRNAVDGDPSTAWLTSTYRTAAFGGLKRGVGLLVDLGRRRTLSRVQVGFTAAGPAVEVRCADTVPASVEGFRTVAAGRAVGTVVSLRPTAGATGRYWLVWLTDLPPDARGYRAGIAELGMR